MTINPATFINLRDTYEHVNGHFPVYGIHIHVTVMRSEQSVNGGVVAQTIHRDSEWEIPWLPRVRVRGKFGRKTFLLQKESLCHALYYPL